MSSVHMCVHACVHLSHFYINVNISFIYEDIFKFAKKIVCGSENMCVKKFCTHLKKKQVAIADCSKIIDMF